jgi:hypothetical protein
MKNIILTGPPRSGTTLTCNLLNKLPGIVALHEPMNLKMFPDRASGLQNIDKFFAQMRTMILDEGQAISKIKEGKIPTNPFSEGKRNRESVVKKGRFAIEKKLDPDFKLIIKQNAHFTFLLEELKEEYPCYTVIRNPLATLASWNSINAPVSRGNLTVLKGIDPVLYHRLESIPDLMDRQLELLDEIFSAYSILREDEIIRYEEISSSGGKALTKIDSGATVLAESLENKNLVKKYDSALIVKLASLLMKNEGAWKQYYTLGDLEKVLNLYI